MPGGLLALRAMDPVAVALLLSLADHVFPHVVIAFPPWVLVTLFLLTCIQGKCLNTGILPSLTPVLCHLLILLLFID